jgi:hypothetical protein
MQGVMPLFLQSIAEPVGIIATLSEPPLGFGKFVLQSGGTDIIADLPCRHEETDRTVIRIGNGREPFDKLRKESLGVHAAFRASDQASRAPFFRKARCRAVALEIGRVDHRRPSFGSLRRCQTFHHPQKQCHELSGEWSVRGIVARASAGNASPSWTVHACSDPNVDFPVDQGINTKRGAARGVKLVQRSISQMAFRLTLAFSPFGNFLQSQPLRLTLTSHLVT